MKILYIISKSVYIIPTQGSILEIIKIMQKEGHEVGILLLQDSVNTCRKGSQNIITQAIKQEVLVFGLKEDLEARGIFKENILSNVIVVDYDEAISLIMDKYEKVINWG